METKLTIKVPIKGNESFIINLDATGSPLPSAAYASDNNIYLSGGVYNRRVVNNSVTPPLYSWSQVKEYEFPTLNNGVEIIDFRYEATRMGNAPTITATFYSYVNYDKIWSSECYVVFKNEKYYLKQKPTFTKDNTDARYKYEAIFISERKILENIYIYDLDSPYFSLKPITQSSVFSFFGDITEFRIRVNASLVKAGLAEIATRTDVIVNNNPNPLYPYYMLVTYSEWVDWGNGTTPAGKNTSDLTRGISNFYTYYGGDYIAYLWGELYFTYDEWLQLGTGTYTGWKITDDSYNEEIAQGTYSHYHANIYDHYEGDYEAYMKGEVYGYQGSDPILTGYQVVIGKDKYGETQTSDEMLVQFDNTTIYDALQQIKETYNLQYYIYKSGNNTYIVIGDSEYEFAQHDGSGNIIRDNTTHLPATPEPFAYGSTNELLSFSKSPNDKKIITRCSGLGSEENIPWYYPNPMADGWLKPIYRRGSSQLNKTIDYPTTEGDTLFEQNRYERWLKNHLLDKFTFGWRYVDVNEMGYEDDAQLSFLQALQAQITYRFRLSQPSLLKTFYEHTYQYGDIVSITIKKDGQTFADTDHAFVPTPNPTTPVTYPDTNSFVSQLTQLYPAGDYEYTFQIKFSQQPTIIDDNTTLWYYYPTKGYTWTLKESVTWKFWYNIIKSVLTGNVLSLVNTLELYNMNIEDWYPPFFSLNPDLEFHSSKDINKVGWFDRNTGNKVSPNPSTMKFGEKDKTYYAFYGGNGIRSRANGDIIYKVVFGNRQVTTMHPDFAETLGFNNYMQVLVASLVNGLPIGHGYIPDLVTDSSVSLETYIEQFFDLRIEGFKEGWYRNGSGKQVALYDYGIDNESELTTGATSADDAHLEDIITFQRYKWLTPIGNLMPEVFRRSDEAERFYNAINYPLSSAVARYIYGEYLNNGLVYNDIYLSPQSVIYQFENLYAQPLICEHIEKFDDIKPTIENATNYILLPSRPPDWTTNWANYYEYDQINHVFMSLSSYATAPYFPTNNTIYYASVLINIAEEYGYDLMDDDSVWVDEEDGNTVGEYKHPHFFVKLRPLGFNLFDLALEGGGDMVLSMKTGACGACNFKIKVDEDTGKNPVQIWEYDVYKKSGDDVFPNYNQSQATYTFMYAKGTLRRYCNEENLFYLVEGTPTSSSAVWRGVNSAAPIVAVENSSQIDDNTAVLANWSLARTRFTNSVYTASSVSNGYVGCLNKENKKHIEGDVRTSGRFIESQQDTTENYVWVALEKESDTYGVLMPYAQPNVQGVAYEKYLRPKGIADVHVPSTNPTTGLPQVESTIDEDEELADRFVLINIRLPQRYIRSAERQLSIAIVKYMYENNFYQYNYSIKFSRIYNAQNLAVAALLNENIVLYINEYDNNVVRQYASNYQFIKKANEILPEIVINVVSELSSYESKEKKQYKRLTGIVQANTRAIDSAVTKQIEGLKSGVVKKNLISNNATDVSPDENTSSSASSGGNGGNGGNGNGNGGGTPSLDTFDMVFTCPDENTLNFYCRNNALGYATLVAGNANEEYYIPNGSLSLTEDKEYYIYVNAVRANAYELSSNSVRIYPFKRSNPNTHTQYVEGEVSVGNNTTQAFVGKVSQINYNTNAQRPYRTVTIWLGEENNPTLAFNGTQISDVDGKFTLKLDSGNTELKLGDVTTGFHFSSNGLKMKKAKMQSEDEEGTIPCYRGDFDLNKVYNEGDEVRVKIDERNYTTVRCLQDGTHGINPLDNSIFWVALAPQSIIDEYSSMVMEKIDETIYQIPTGETRSFKPNTTRVYLDGVRIFHTIDYIEPSQREITLINPPQSDIEKVVIEAIFE